MGDICCLLVILIIIVMIIAYICDLKKKKEEEINRYKESIDSKRRNFCNTLNVFWQTSYYGYNETYETLKRIIADMKRENEILVRKSKEDSETEMISQLAQFAEKFNAFGNALKTLPDTRIMDINNYGHIQKEYWITFQNQGKENVDSYIQSCEDVIKNVENDKILKIDIEQVLKCIWFYATEKPYSAESFQKAVKVFEQIYKGRIADLDIAEFYAIKQVSGEEILQEKWKDLQYSKEKMEIFASAFMWMNAYQSENAVLQYILTEGVQMSEKAQNRLHALSNGGSNAPEGFEVSSDDKDLYFDVSVLAWRDEEYTGFFENLAFQDKKLTYSLAIRDEDKDLFITQSGNSLDINRVLIKLREVFKEEYGDTVLAEVKNCIALSGSGEERIQGILSVSKECKQMGILVHIAKIGKKLNIKFYTLFMPDVNQLMEQKQQALSLYKKLSPSISMWESSLKDTILMVVQQLLNTTDSQKDINSLKDIDSPIF